jgi:hypothetical protein
VKRETRHRDHAKPIIPLLSTLPSEREDRVREIPPQKSHGTPLAMQSRLCLVGDRNAVGLFATGKKREQDKQKEADDQGDN